MTIKKLYCSRCDEVIDQTREYVVQDKTGHPFCAECRDHYVDVTTVFPAQD